MNELSLFSGAGGGLLATKHLLGWNTIGYVEWNDYCQQVIAQRIKDGLLDDAPIFGDINTFISEGYAESYKGLVDVITGGFPCQDISSAGRGAGICEGTRSGLWIKMANIISKVRPKYVFLENSPMLTLRGLGRVIGDLSSMGFDAKWGVLGADLFGLQHHRARTWLVANSELAVQKDYKRVFGPVSLEPISEWASSITFPHFPYKLIKPKNSDFTYRKDNGLARAMDRVGAIGNGQVPIVAATAWRILSGIDNQQ